MSIDANLFIVYTCTIILGDFLGLHMGYIYSIYVGVFGFILKTNSKSLSY